MYFPLIERRFYTGDRRAGKLDRRQRQQSVSQQNEKRSNAARRVGKERRVLKLDRETLLHAALLLKDNPLAQLAKENSPEQSKTLSICSLILVPLVIAGASFFVTNSINKQQAQNAQLLADQQAKNAQLIANQELESAMLIAKGQQENASQIANADMETQHLEHMAQIFSSIISPKAGDDNSDIINQRIESLAVYGDEALPFLLQILRYRSNNNASIGNPEIKKVAEHTISRIISHSQLDLSKQEIFGKPNKAPVNLRNKVYANYNLNGSKFNHVNLYKADFSGASLQDAEFSSVDLQETNFQGANLKDAKFNKAILRHADFSSAFLEGVTFTDCEYIENAKFSLHTLLRADKEPVELISPRAYTLLLMNYEEQLEAIFNEEKGKLEKVYDKLNMTGFEELQKKFKAYRVKGKASIKTKQKVQLSMNP